MGTGSLKPEHIVNHLAFIAQQAADAAAYVERLPWSKARRDDLLADLLKTNILSWQKTWRAEGPRVP